jgi:hypothetical protein
VITSTVVVDDPLYESHPPTDGTLQQLRPRQLVDQRDRPVDVLLGFCVHGLSRGIRQTIPQLVDGPTNLLPSCHTIGG